MLLIAIPKSASTSLLHTIGEIHNIKSQQDFESVKDNLIPNQFGFIGKYHSDCRELDYKNKEKWSTADKLYKQHIPPTNNNLMLLDSLKKVVLLRDPREIILAYHRAESKGLHENRTEFKGCETEKEWINRAKEIGLHNELENFFEGWENAETGKLLIRFEDLISDETEVLKAISEYFDLPIKDKDLMNFKLKKHRYSRHNHIQKYVHKIVSRFQKIISH